MPRSSRSKKATTESPATTDVELPQDDASSKPKRPSRGKRRVSSMNPPPEAEASFASSQGGDGPERRPLVSVDINDDREEKKRRRKSAAARTFQNFGDAQESSFAGPSASKGTSEPDPDGETSTRPKITALARANQLNAVAHAPMPAVSLDVMSSNFEEWMKMATDNKINAANSWNFALIDYFHDMTLLKNRTDDSINFQKASFTLDGCVKIWTSRVDSVGTETGKLLSNLADDGREDQDEDRDEEGNEEGDVQGERTKKRKAHRAEATLAKSFDQLRTKKLDLEFAVDPLFKKTCADFDEGGAMGLLMNHLSIDGNMRVVFDAGDSKVAEEEGEELEPEAVNLAEVRATLGHALESLESKAISHTLADFCFSSENSNFDFTFSNATLHQDSFHGLGGDDDDDDDHGAADPFAEGFDQGGDAGDFFVGDQAVGDDFGGDFGGGMDMDGGMGMDGGFDAGINEGGHPPAPGGPQRPLEPFDPRVPNQRELVMAMTQGDGQSLDYFDVNFMKNWAGPEHWKIRRAAPKKDANADDGGPAAPKAKREKQAFQISFLEPATLEASSKHLFVAAKPATIALPAAAGASLPSTRKGRGKKRDTGKKDDHLLPDDMHFSSQQLLRLFLKPKFTLKMRRQLNGANPAGDDEVDEHFWARQAAVQAAGAGDTDDYTNDGAIPFNTQFFHDDGDDGPGFDDDMDMGDIGLGSNNEPGHRSMEEEDLLAATQGQQVRHVRPEFVNYAKRAKRVDVKKLKDNIWKSLDIVVDTKAGDGDDEQEAEAATRPATDPTDGRGFTSVIDNLRKSYPKEKMEEISTSFCFICLLHLANEHGLKIESNTSGQRLAGEPDEEEEEEEEEEDGDDAARGEGDRKVGNLWGLKVYRDPNTPVST